MLVDKIKKFCWDVPREFLLTSAVEISRQPSTSVNPEDRSR